MDARLGHWLPDGGLHVRGQVVSHYEILDQLGQGGMGDVYVARDRTLGRKVALKAIRADRRLSEQAKHRFVREARILSKLDHPNICRIYDYVSDEQGDFLVLELIDGQTLTKVIAERPDHAACMKVAEQVTNVLVAAHAEGVVHRDLKPANLMLKADGELKVLDFGLARAGESVSEPGRQPEEREETAGSDVKRTDHDATATSDGLTPRRPPLLTSFQRSQPRRNGAPTIRLSSGRCSEH